jgi:hypothetical protein
VAIVLVLIHVLMNAQATVNSYIGRPTGVGLFFSVCVPFSSLSGVKHGRCSASWLSIGFGLDRVHDLSMSDKIHAFVVSSHVVPFVCLFVISMN